jgi:hypothetical protein
MPTRHTPPQPSRDSLLPEDLAAYDSVVARQHAYDYVAFAEMFPSAHREAVDACLLQAIGGEADPEHEVQPYMGAMLNSPAFMALLSDIGAVARSKGDTEGSYSHADREWVDMVISQELGHWGIYYLHMLDAVGSGVRVDAIAALRSGHDGDLTEDERLLRDFVRTVIEGRVDAEIYGRIEDRLGRRGAVEYTQLIGFLLITVRLSQAFDSMPQFSPQMVDELLELIKAGDVQLPSAPRVSTLTKA